MYMYVHWVRRRHVHTDWDLQIEGKYFTLLRHPMARMQSAYDYFCRDCAENGRFCKNKRFRARNGNLCPSMEVHDFAFLVGNAYVHELSGAYACTPCTLPEDVKSGEAPSRQFFETCGQLLHVVDGATSEAAKRREMLAIAKAHLGPGGSVMYVRVIICVTVSQRFLLVIN